MNEIKIADVQIPENRIRRKFDEEAIAALADSMEAIGLLQPIVLRGGTAILLAGERRLRASRLLLSTGRRVRGFPAGIIPVVFSTDLSSEALLQAELEENILRKDLTWQEIAVATDQLHKLRSTQNGAQTMRATAQELGLAPSSSTSMVRDNIILAANLHDPDVAQAKDKKQAIKVVLKKKEQAILAALGSAADLRKGDWSMQEGDCLQLLQGYLPDTFHCIITDPPYGIAMKNKGQGILQHDYEDEAIDVLPMLDAVIKELYRVAAAQAHLYMFCDIDNFQKLRLMMIMAGWKPWRTLIVWDKGAQGFLPRPNHGPRRTHELLIFASKGNKEVKLVGAHDVIRVNQDKSLIHPAQKPIGVYEDLMSRSCFPGDKVLDPFCGRGTIFLAARAKGLIATGIELDPQMAAIARLNASGELIPDGDIPDDNSGGSGG